MLGTTCESCNARKGCGWCSTTNVCVDVISSTCSGLWVHACGTTPVTPPQKCGFDGGAFVGGMFLVIGLIVLGVLAFIVYRWKSGIVIHNTQK